MTWGIKKHPSTGVRGLMRFGESPDRALVKKTVNGILEDAGKFVHDTILSYLAKGRAGNTHWPPLSQVTVWLRQLRALKNKKIKKGNIDKTSTDNAGGGDKPYVDTGDFKNAIDMHIEPDRVVVGMLTPVGPKGQDMWMIARIMEGGATIPVSEKMRGWMAARGVPLKRETTAIHIPPRPLFRPASDVLSNNLDKIIVKAMNKMFKEMGVWGIVTHA